MSITTAIAGAMMLAGVGMIIIPDSMHVIGIGVVIACAGLHVWHDHRVTKFHVREEGNFVRYADIVRRRTPVPRVTHINDHRETASRW